MTTTIDSGEHSANPQNNADSHDFPIDVEHQGIRLAVPALILVAFVISYFLSFILLNALLPTSATGCITFLAAGGVAMLMATRGQRVLERLWSSGRSLSTDHDGLEVRDVRKRQNKVSRITWNQRVNPLFWRFAVQRGSGRVPRGWFMLGLQLLQDETVVTLYTFMPEKTAKALAAYNAFISLVHRTEIERDDVGLREKIEQRRLHKAEDQRWSDGGELRREDFVAVVDLITQHIPDWQDNA